jgi:hypothetical protein
MEGNGGQVRAEGTAIPSTASDDVDMMDGQDQETVPGSWQDHALCMLCMESKDQERREHVTVKLDKCKSLTPMVDQLQKYHKEEWVEDYKTGQLQQSIKSFNSQHSPKKTQSQPAETEPAESISGTTHSSLEIGVVERPDSSRGATAHTLLLTLVWCSCLMSRSTKKRQCG